MEWRVHLTYQWSSVIKKNPSAAFPNVSLIQDSFNFQGSFVKIYRNVTGKFKDKKPASKLEIPENKARWVLARKISLKVFERSWLSYLRFHEKYELEHGFALALNDQ